MRYNPCGGREERWQVSSLLQMACSAPVAAFSGFQPSRTAPSGFLEKQEHEHFGNHGWGRMLRHAPESGLRKAWVGVCRMQAVAQSAHKEQSQGTESRKVPLRRRCTGTCQSRAAEAGGFHGCPPPTHACETGQEPGGGVCRRVDVAQESRSLVGREGGWWTAVCLLSLTQCGWALWASSQVQQRQ